MSETVTADLEELKAEWTPKQRENWENHGAEVFAGIEEAETLAEENGAEIDTENAKEWYLRTYRPKKRGEGMMLRDHVKTGEPEKYMEAFMDKLGSPYGSIQGLVMHSMFTDDETREEIEDAATVITVAKHLGSALGKAELAKKLQEHEEVAALYGR